MFPEGQLHFEFLTHVTNDHVELQDFQPCRRLFGVYKQKCRNIEKSIY